MNRFDTFSRIVVYNFHAGCGGIGDCLKFFMFILESCMKTETRLYYKVNHLEIENFIRLKYEKMYIKEEDDDRLQRGKIVTPKMYYRTQNYEYSIDIKDVFYFTDEVLSNSHTLFPLWDSSPYISIHLRLGDKHLETDRSYVVCKNDARKFSEEQIHKFIEEESVKGEKIFFCCDNDQFKLKIKQQHDQIIITRCDIGHTDLLNTTMKQVLDAVTEFFLLTQSKTIFAATYSGFPTVASKFNNIPLVCGWVNVP